MLGPSLLEPSVGDLTDLGIAGAAALTMVVHHGDVSHEPCSLAARLHPKCVVGVLEIGRVVVPVETTEGDMIGATHEPAGG